MGVWSVWGRSRLPRPAARTIALVGGWFRKFMGQLSGTFSVPKKLILSLLVNSDKRSYKQGIVQGGSVHNCVCVWDVIVRERQKKGFFHRLGGMFRRSSGWLELHESHAEDVWSDVPVLVGEKGAVTGNVIAPKLVVEGVLYGFVVARDVVVRPGGQIWGDVHAKTFQIENSGRVFGWVSTSGETSYESFYDGDKLVAQLPEPEPIQLPAQLYTPDGQSIDLVAAEDPAGQLDRIALLRTLQGETAVALLARAELEENFEARVAEVAGDTLRLAQGLDDELAEARSRLSNTQAQLEEKGVEVRKREAHVDELHSELSGLRDLLEDRSNALDDMQGLLYERTQNLERTESARQTLEEQLQDVTIRADTMSGRAENLEGALQASLQRTTEQEEALLRWQELADVTQTQANELQKELDEAKLQVEESHGVVELLREQRARAEKAWEDAIEEMEELRAQTPDESQAIQETELRLASSDKRIGELETHINEREEAFKSLQEQVLWQKASIETMGKQLTDSQRVIDEQNEYIDQVDGEIASVQGTSEQLIALTAKLDERDERIRVLTEEHEMRLSTIQRQVRERDMQLEAMELELDKNYSEVKSQGSRLAEIRMELVESQLELEEVQSRLATRTQEVGMVKQIAAKHVRQLRTELVKAQQQTRDLMALVERKRSKQ